MVKFLGLRLAQAQMFGSPYAAVVYETLQSLEKAQPHLPLASDKRQIRQLALHIGHTMFSNA